MSVDKFGRHSRSRVSGPRGLPGAGFNLTRTNDFDLKYKRITNLDEPIDKSDAATKNYVDVEIIRLSEQMINFGGKLTYLESINFIIPGDGKHEASTDHKADSSK